MEDEPPSFAHVVLGSASPRRRALLEAAGMSFSVLVPKVDETIENDESPEQAAIRLAKQKAAACLATSFDRPSIVVTADTIVVLDGHILGKPRNSTHALELLTQLNGRTHQVITGVAVTRTDIDSYPQQHDPSNRPHRYEGAVATDVSFGDWPESVLRGYVETGECLDKAGAYGIQGQGGTLVTEVRGSVSNVIGLPIAQTLQWIQAAGGPPPFWGNR